MIRVLGCGAGGHAKVVIEILRSMREYEIVGLLDTRLERGASVLGVTALSLLELFVAFLQAYVFTFLSALYIGGALHPHH